MKLDYIKNKNWTLLSNIALVFVCSSFYNTSYAVTPTINSSNLPVQAIVAKPKQSMVVAVAKPQPSKVVKEDYFISADTVIIGCTSGMAAGILVGSVPVAGAVMSGIGLPESVSLLINMAGMGCGVGAVSGAVAILTAWMLQPD